MRAWQKKRYLQLEVRNMNIVVCIKQVPEVGDAELEINRDGTDILREDLEFEINEWDNYAVEEAVRLKEVNGGKVTVVTLGDEDSEDVLRHALAMGADEAIQIEEEGFEGSDGLSIAKALYRVLKDLSFDLVMTGVQSSDDGMGQVGVYLAGMLDLPYATLVIKIEKKEDGIIVNRELEANTQERLEMTLPAVLTIQTGINTPRYVSIMGIQKVRKVAINEVSAEDLGLDSEDIGSEGSIFSSLHFSMPQLGEGAEMLTGSIEKMSEQAAGIIRDKGGMS